MLEGEQYYCSSSVMACTTSVNQLCKVAAVGQQHISECCIIEAFGCHGAICQTSNIYHWRVHTLQSSRDAITARRSMPEVFHGSATSKRSICKAAMMPTAEQYMTAGSSKCRGNAFVVRMYIDALYCCNARCSQSSALKPWAQTFLQ